MALPKTWALVTNGVRARILRGLDGSGGGEEPIELHSKAASTHLGEIMADQAGRSFASDASGRRSAMEPGSDPVQRTMQDFAREILDSLEAHRHEGRLGRLAIFAAPRMLGILRHEMPASLGETVVLERDLNIVNLPDAELRDAVTEALGQGSLK
ncbi:host attachment protein [Roseibacterium sp. SDUM158017]|uniref:host attachment protein n=1 Tax=Roseicyclus salinarum TaxID=3036773 RepID=UPI0024157155|nr:host attachment protein [Roseibacterium sp. SDUM158017]MDG4648451.1 host attachment protein [Roseibacterium sp. SDUM158017]